MIDFPQLNSHQSKNEVQILICKRRIDVIYFQHFLIQDPKMTIEEAKSKIDDVVKGQIINQTIDTSIVHMERINVNYLNNNGTYKEFKDHVEYVLKELNSPRSYEMSQNKGHHIQYFLRFARTTALKHNKLNDALKYSKKFDQKVNIMIGKAQNLNDLEYFTSQLQETENIKKLIEAQKYRRKIIGTAVGVAAILGIAGFAYWIYNRKD